MPKVTESCFMEQSEMETRLWSVSGQLKHLILCFVPVVVVTSSGIEFVAMIVRFVVINCSGSVRSMVLSRMKFVIEAWAP